MGAARQAAVRAVTKNCPWFGCFRNDLSARRGRRNPYFSSQQIVEPLSHIFHYRTNASAGVVVRIWAD